MVLAERREERVVFDHGGLMQVNAPKECGMHCSIEMGRFEHELEAILGEAHGLTIVEEALSNGGAHGRRAQD